jgi:hypothetical protein
MSPNRAFNILSVSLSLAACGGSTETAKHPATDRSRSERADSTAAIGATAEIGAMPEEETQYALKESFDGIRKCFMDGSRRIEFLGGEIAVNVTIGSAGTVAEVFAERSTLGDRRTEKCMFEALRQVSWPKPVGGPIGIAQGAFDFEMPGDVRPPVTWDADQVSDAVAREADKISACKQKPSSHYQATVYVDADGKPLAAGISAPSREAEGASDCLIDVLMSVSFPDPGSWPAKVSFPI